MQRFVRVAAPMLAAALLLCPATAPAATVEEQVALGRASLSRARNLGDPAALELSRQFFLQAAKAEPARALGHYYVALANWELALTVRAAGGADRVSDLAREGVRHCDELLERDPNHAEAVALRGALRRLWATVPGADDALQEQGEEDFRRAQALGGGNPRVWLVSGATRHGCAASPRTGADRALRDISRSIELFERVPQTLAELSGGTPNAPVRGRPESWGSPGLPPAPPDDGAPTPTRPVSLEPDWGHSEAWFWAGRVHLDAERFEAARRCFQKTLELNPACEIVRTQYLPRAEAQSPASSPGGTGKPSSGGAATTPFGAPFRDPARR